VVRNPRTRIESRPKSLNSRKRIGRLLVGHGAVSDAPRAIWLWLAASMAQAVESQHCRLDHRRRWLLRHRHAPHHLGGGGVAALASATWLRQLASTFWLPVPGGRRLQRFARSGGIEPAPRPPPARNREPFAGQRSSISLPRDEQPSCCQSASANILDRRPEAERRTRSGSPTSPISIWTAEGWLYVAAVIDLFSRRVAGRSMSATMTA
jgi:transposase InsO family protein